MQRQLYVFTGRSFAARIVLLCAVAMLCASIVSIAAAQDAAADTAVTSRDACGLTTGRTESFHQFDDGVSADFEYPADISWSPDSQYLAVWLRRFPRVIVPDPTPAGWIDISPDYDSYLQIWHVPSRTLMHELYVGKFSEGVISNPWTFTWRNDSQGIAVAHNRRMHVWQGGDDWSFVLPTDGERFNAAEMFWIDDNQIFMFVRAIGTVPPGVSSGGGQALYYDAATGDLMESGPAYLQLHFIQMNNNLLQMTRDETTLTITDLSRDEVLFVAPPDHYFVTMRSVDGMTVLVSRVSYQDNPTSDYSTTTVWNINTGELLLTFDGQRYNFAQFNLSPDGRVFAVNTTDRGMEFWDVQNGQLLAVQATYESTQERDVYNVIAPIWSPDSECLIALGRNTPFAEESFNAPLVMVDQTNYVDNEVLTEERLRYYKQPWSPDSRMLAYLVRDSEDLRIWYRDDMEAHDAGTADD